jgi:hypothetical protein
MLCIGNSCRLFWAGICNRAFEKSGGTADVERTDWMLRGVLQNLQGVYNAYLQRLQNRT